MNNPLDTQIITIKRMDAQEKAKFYPPQKTLDQPISHGK